MPQELLKKGDKKIITVEQAWAIVETGDKLNRNGHRIALEEKIAWESHEKQEGEKSGE